MITGPLVKPRVHEQDYSDIRLRHYKYIYHLTMNIQYSRSDRPMSQLSKLTHIKCLRKLDGNWDVMYNPHRLLKPSIHSIRSTKGFILTKSYNNLTHLENWKSGKDVVKFNDIPRVVSQVRFLTIDCDYYFQNVNAEEKLCRILKKAINVEYLKFNFTPFTWDIFTIFAFLCCQHLQRLKYVSIELNYNKYAHYSEIGQDFEMLDTEPLILKQGFDTIETALDRLSDKIIAVSCWNVDSAFPFYKLETFQNLQKLQYETFYYGSHMKMKPIYSPNLNQVRDLNITLNSRKEFLQLKLPTSLQSLHIRSPGMESQEDFEQIYRENFCSMLKEVRALRNFFLKLDHHSGKPWIRRLIDSLPDELESFCLNEKTSYNQEYQRIDIFLKRFTKLKELILHVYYRWTAIVDRDIKVSSIETLRIPIGLWSDPESILCPALQDTLISLEINGNGDKIGYFDSLLSLCAQFRKLNHLSLTCFDVRSKKYRFWGKRPSDKVNLGQAILKLVANLPRLTSLEVRLRGVGINRFERNVVDRLKYLKRLTKCDIHFYSYRSEEEKKDPRKMNIFNALTDGTEE